jgi:hypothetical protein
VSTLLHTFLHNLLNVLVQIAKKKWDYKIHFDETDL